MPLQPPTAPTTLAHALYRLRLPVTAAAGAILIANALLLLFDPTTRLPSAVRSIWVTVVLAALLALALSLIAAIALRRHATSATSRRQPAPVAPPVVGRWLALNSPATAVPSHGTSAYGQTFAIDLVAVPGDRLRPEFGGETFRPAAAYPAFGAPVTAMIDGIVVRASGWQRDHRARSNLVGFGYLLVEGMLRQLAGPTLIVGNHVVIRGDDGRFAVVAHLRRGSLTVRAGDRVRAGDLLGTCGNSGNSSEPHVHAQLMDGPSFWTAQGLPMTFVNVTIEPSGAAGREFGSAGGGGEGGGARRDGDPGGGDLGDNDGAGGSDGAPHGARLGLPANGEAMRAAAWPPRPVSPQREH